MTTTDQCIADLSQKAALSRPPHTPRYWAVRLLLVLAAYSVAAQFFLGIRPDIAAQFSRPLFVMEIVLLGSLAVAGAVAAVFALYPDTYQKPWLLLLPHGIFLLLVGLLLLEFIAPAGEKMEATGPIEMLLECAFCIAAVALLPSAIIFILLRRGASVHPFQAGTLAILTSSAISGLTLRLAEESNSISHLILSHYAPTLAFAIMGSFAGRKLLKW